MVACAIISRSMTWQSPKDFFEAIAVSILRVHKVIVETASCLT